jgi:cytochrome bd-type quinol oxidase subunit 2
VTTNLFKLVLLINAALYGAAWLMLAKLAATNASVEQRPYSWSEDWLLLAVLGVLALLNVVTIAFVIQRER